MLNIVSLILGATGLAVVFLDFGPREVNATFWNHNPYAVKRDAIVGARDRAFLGVAACSALIQLVAENWGGRIQERAYTATQYCGFTAAVALALAAVSFGMWKAALCFARRAWQPEVISLSTWAFQRPQYRLGHDTLTQEQVAEA